MEIVIWGVTELGRFLVNNIKIGNKNIVPKAFVDNNSKYWNTRVEGILVISYEELLKKKNLKEIIILLAVKNAKNIFQILKQIENLPILRIGIVSPKVLYVNSSVNVLKNQGEIIWYILSGEKNRVIPRIEVNLIDACNLKCKGCTHFSSIFKNDSVYDLSEFKNDLIQLRKVGQMVRLRLLGGEPFLLSNLDEYITIARDIYSETDIEIVTNGLLIPKIDEKVLLSIRNNDVSVVISPYLPTLKMKEEIIGRLDRYGILWYFDGEKILQFSRNLTLKNTHNAEAANDNCLSAGCTFLRKGKIYKCPFDGLINDFYNYYELEMQHESGLDIYQNGDIVYEGLVNYALKSVKMCEYCVENPEYIPWSIKENPLLNSWLYKDGKSV